jgi:hypothetical protein
MPLSRPRTTRIRAGLPVPRPLAAVLLVPAVLAACAACDPAPAAPPSAGATGPAAAAKSATAAAATPAQPPSAVPSRAPGCDMRSLELTVGATSSGAGHRSVAVVVTNYGTGTCVLRGYPEVTAHTAVDPTPVAARRTPSGYLGGAADSPFPTVRLAPEGQASMTVEALGFRVSDGASLPPYVSMRVTLPGGQPTELAWPSEIGDSCDQLEVHPLVPGPTGQLRG